MTTRKHYSVDQQFLVTYAYHSRTESFESFQLTRIDNITLGLHDTLEQAKDQILSDGEVACALSNSLHAIFDDDVYKNSYTSLVNWWPI